MDPARMFKESLASRPELENSQGQKRTSVDARFTPKRGHSITAHSANPT